MIAANQITRRLLWLHTPPKTPHTHFIEMTPISYVLKDIPMPELTQAIQRAARGEATLNPVVAARVIQEMRGTRSNAFNPFTELTEREMEILRLLADGLSNNEIGARLVITENTVKGHVSNLLGKLHLADRTQAAIYAWREGIVRKE